jgi:hypothetical protein
VEDHLAQFEAQDRLAQRKALAEQCAALERRVVGKRWEHAAWKEGKHKGRDRDHDDE